jgi:hypothetical protein
MYRPVTPGTSSLKALSIVVALGAVAHAAIPYLPLIGPPAMRVQKIKSPTAAVVKFQEIKKADSAATNTLPTLGSKNFPADTNAIKAAETMIPWIAGLLTGANPDTDTPLSDTFTASIFDLPTPDLLGISPQMLATYFRPVKGGTNTVGLVGAFPLSFVPPVPPDKSSHAEYIIK